MNAFVNGLILSVPFTALVWLLLRLTPRRALNAATRHAIWWIAIAVILATPLLFLPLPRFAQIVTTTVAPAPPQTLGAMVSRMDSLPLTASTGTPPASRFPLRVSTGPWMVWLLGAWIMASVLLLLRLVMSYRTLERYKLRATPIGGRVALSHEIAAPMAAGPLRPCILIPAALLDRVSPAELDQIIRHETAHLTRRDDLTLLLQRILEALLPWHPALRFATRHMSFEREVACDDFVIASASGARQYAECLTHLAELANPSGPLAANAALRSRSHLVRRVDLLFDKTRHTGTRLLRTRFAAAAMLLAGACWLAAQSPALVAFAAPLAPREPVHMLTPLPPPLPPSRLMAQAAPVVPSMTPPKPPTMVVPVLVTEMGQGRVVTGLNRENFELYEDNIKLDITGFSDSTGPVSIAIVLDSQRGGEDVNAILTRMGTGNEADEFFYSSLHGPLPMPGPFGAQAIPENPTGLLDAIAHAADRLQTARNAQRSLWILTDGGEGSFGRTAEQLIAAARAARAQVYVFRPKGPEISPEIATLLDSLAGQTGGMTTAFDEMLTIPAAVTRVLIANRNQYHLEFAPKSPQHEGFHSLTVRVNLPGLELRSRAGYWVP